MFLDALVVAVAGSIPAPIPVEVTDKTNEFGWPEVFSLVSTIGNVVLLVVTGFTLAANRRMVNSSNRAAEAASESAAAAASQVQVKFVAEPDLTIWKSEMYGFEYDDSERIDLQQKMQSYPTRWAIPDRLFDRQGELDAEYEDKVAKHKLAYQNTPTEVRVNVYIRVEGAAVEVHRVALVEYPFSRHARLAPPTVAGRTPNMAPDFFWGYRSPSLAGASTLLHPGDRYLFETSHDLVLAPNMIGAFLTHNRFAVEYSFVGSQVKRVARAYLAKPETHNGIEVPAFGGALTELPTILTTDELGDRVALAEQTAQVNPLEREHESSPEDGAAPPNSGRYRRLYGILRWLQETT